MPYSTKFPFNNEGLTSRFTMTMQINFVTDTDNLQLADIWSHLNHDITRSRRVTCIVRLTVDLAARSDIKIPANTRQVIKP